MDTLLGTIERAKHSSVKVFFSSLRNERCVWVKTWGSWDSQTDSQTARQADRSSYLAKLCWELLLMWSTDVGFADTPPGTGTYRNRPFMLFHVSEGDFSYDKLRVCDLLGRRGVRMMMRMRMIAASVDVYDMKSG